MSLAFRNTNGSWKYVINFDNLSGNIFLMFYPCKHSQPSRYFECFNISLSQVSSTLLWYHLWTFFSYLENKLPINYEGCFLLGLYFPFLVAVQHSASKISLCWIWILLIISNTVISLIHAYTVFTTLQFTVN